MSAATRARPTPSPADADAAFAERQRGLYAAILHAATAERLSPDEREAAITALIAIELPALYSGQEPELVPTLDSRFWEDAPLLWARWIRPTLEAAPDAELQTRCIATLMRQHDTARMWEEHRAFTAMKMRNVRKHRNPQTETAHAAFHAAAEHFRALGLTLPRALYRLTHEPFTHEQIIVSAAAVDRESDEYVVNARDHDGVVIGRLSQKSFANTIWLRHRGARGAVIGKGAF